MQLRKSVPQAIVPQAIRPASHRLLRSGFPLRLLPGVETNATKSTHQMVRGASDINLTNLQDAANKIALFEEKVIYHMVQEACADERHPLHHRTLHLPDS
ncbi:MAG: encapsulin [Deltaproteobacteria bacterium]|nr:encapsulin [Deltaproteobacteria bacterium]